MLMTNTFFTGNDGHRADHDANQRERAHAPNIPNTHTQYYVMFENNPSPHCSANRQKTVNTARIVFMSIALMLILLVQSWSADAYLTDLPGLSAHFFDVGQGDSTLLMTDDVTILIDAGRHDRNDVVPLLQSLNI